MNRSSQADKTGKGILGRGWGLHTSKDMEMRKANVFGRGRGEWRQPGGDSWKHTGVAWTVMQRSGRHPGHRREPARVLRWGGAELDQWTKNFFRTPTWQMLVWKVTILRVWDATKAGSMLPLHCHGCQTSPKLAPNCHLPQLLELHLHRAFSKRCEILLLLKRNQRNKSLL